MLGDAGANVVGAVLGLGVVLGPGRDHPRHRARDRDRADDRWPRWSSFSRIIDRVPPLRWLDRLGTTPERKPPDADLCSAS